MYKIRLVEEKDWPAVLVMAEKFYKMTEYPGNIPADEATMYDLFRTLQESGFMYVIDVEGEAVAMIGCLVVPFLLNSNFLTCTEIMWWVNPEHRGTAMATELMRVAEETAQERGCSFIAMTKLSTSPDVVDKIYKRRGYRMAESAYLKEL